MNKQLAQVHILPTDKIEDDSIILVNKLVQNNFKLNNKLGWAHKSKFQPEDTWWKQSGAIITEEVKEGKVIAQYFYFTSNEEIKEGDWKLHPKSKIVDKATNSDFCWIPRNKLGIHGWLKIVATTNPELWYKELPDVSFRAHPNTFNKVRNVAKIPQSFIETYIKAYNEGKPIKQVWLENEGCDICDNTGYYDEGDACESKCSRCRGVENAYVRLKLTDGEVIIVPNEEKLYARTEFWEGIRECFNKTKKGELNFVNLSRWFNKNYPE